MLSLGQKKFFVYSLRTRMVILSADKNLDINVITLKISEEQKLENRKKIIRAAVETITEKGIKTATRMSWKALEYLARKPFSTEEKRFEAKSAMNRESAALLFEGLSLLRGTALQERELIAQTLYDLFIFGLYQLHCIHADPNPGNFIVDAVRHHLLSLP